MNIVTPLFASVKAEGQLPLERRKVFKRVRVVVGGNRRKTADVLCVRLKSCTSVVEIIQPITGDTSLQVNTPAKANERHNLALPEKINGLHYTLVDTIPGQSWLSQSTPQNSSTSDRYRQEHLGCWRRPSVSPGRERRCGHSCRPDILHDTTVRRCVRELTESCPQSLSASATKCAIVKGRQWRWYNSAVGQRQTIIVAALVVASVVHSQSVRSAKQSATRQRRSGGASQQGIETTWGTEENWRIAENDTENQALSAVGGEAVKLPRQTG